MPLLTVEQLSLRHQASGRQVLMPTSWQLNAGECLAVVGESGSGKSLQAMALMGVLDPKIWQMEGTAHWCPAANSSPSQLIGLNEAEFRPLRGKQLAWVPQDPNGALNPLRTLGSQMAEPLKVLDGLDDAAARARMLQALDDVRLPQPVELLDRYPHQLSGGQKQRAALALALARGPQLLIADEPTTALDPELQWALVALLAELQRKRGLALMFITHDLGLAAALAQQMLVLYKGEVMDYGPTEQVLTNPKHAYTRALWACRPSVQHRLNRLPTLADIWPEVERMEGNVGAKNMAAPPPSPSVGEEAGMAPPLPPSMRGEMVAHPQTPSEGEDDVTAPPLSPSMRGEMVAAPTPALLAGRQLTFSVPVGNWPRTGWRQLLQPCDVLIAPGERIALVGASGGGKTTLARLLGGLQAPSSGQLLWQGQPCPVQGTAWRAWRRQVQFVFQDAGGSLNPRQTALQALVEPLLAHDVTTSAGAEQRALDWLCRVGLGTELAQRRPAQLSGGQRQRLAIARALVLEPKLLVCDEPTSALDVSVQAQILNLIADLCQDMGLGLLLVSHDMAVVRQMADTVWVMDAGQLVERGPVPTVFAAPAHAATLRLLHPQTQPA